MNRLPFVVPSNQLRALNRRAIRAWPWLLVVGIVASMPGQALDLVGFTGITGPLSGALTTIASLGPAIKALIGFISFVVAIIALAGLRNFSPVLSFIGLAIFASVGLVAAGSIMGAVI